VVSFTMMLERPIKEFKLFEGGRATLLFFLQFLQGFSEVRFAIQPKSMLQRNIPSTAKTTL